MHSSKSSGQLAFFPLIDKIKNDLAQPAAPLFVPFAHHVQCLPFYLFFLRDIFLSVGMCVRAIFEVCLSMCVCGFMYTFVCLNKGMHVFID